MSCTSSRGRRRSSLWRGINGRQNLCRAMTDLQLRFLQLRILLCVCMLRMTAERRWRADNTGFDINGIAMVTILCDAPDWRALSSAGCSARIRGAVA